MEIINSEQYKSQSPAMDHGSFDVMRDVHRDALRSILSHIEVSSIDMILIKQVCHTFYTLIVELHPLDHTYVNINRAYTHDLEYIVHCLPPIESQHQWNQLMSTSLKFNLMDNIAWIDARHCTPSYYIEQAAKYNRWSWVQSWLNNEFLDQRESHEKDCLTLRKAYESALSVAHSDRIFQISNFHVAKPSRSHRLGENQREHLYTSRCYLVDKCLHYAIIDQQLDIVTWLWKMIRELEVKLSNNLFTRHFKHYDQLRPTQFSALIQTKNQQLLEWCATNDLQPDEHCYYLESFELHDLSYTQQLYHDYDNSPPLKFLRWDSSNPSYIKNRNPIMMAAKANNLAVLQWLLSLQIPLPPLHCIYSTDIACLEYLAQHYTSETLNLSHVGYAYQRGAFKTVRWLYDHTQCLPATLEIDFIRSLAYGDDDYLEIMLDRREFLQYRLASEQGVNVLKAWFKYTDQMPTMRSIHWLMTHGFSAIDKHDLNLFKEITDDTQSMTTAAQFELYQWWCIHFPGTLSARILTQVIQTGRFDRVQWLLDHGCVLNNAILVQVVHRVSLKMNQWLYERNYHSININACFKKTIEHLQTENLKTAVWLMELDFKACFQLETSEFVQLIHQKHECQLF